MTQAKRKTATYAVSVVDTSVASLTITKKPTKLIYYRGTSLVTTGMSLTAVLTDGTTQTVTSGFTCSPTTLTVSGTRTIIVTYGNASAYFTVTVNEPVVSALAVIHLGLGNRIAGVDQVDEVHAFDDATIFHIETRDDALGKHNDSPR